MSDPLGKTEMIAIYRADAVSPSSHLNRRHLLGMGLGAMAAGGVGLGVPVAVVAQTADASGLRYSDGIAAARTMIVLQGNAAALQRRLPSGWELAPIRETTCAEPRSATAICSSHSMKSMRFGTMMAVSQTCRRRAMSPSSRRPAT